MRDITLGQFVAGDSVIHKLDPRTKIGMMILYIVMTFLVKKIYFLAIPFAYLVIELVLSGISLRYILNSLKPIRFLLIFMFLLNLFFTKGEHVWLDLGFWQLTGEAVLQSCFLAVRIILLVAGASMLTLTTSPIALTDGIERLFAPLKIFHFPAHELAMMMTIALRFVPTLMDESEKIRNAQMSRGADFESGNIFKRVKSMIPILIPLFVSSFRKADELAIAMESRCYHGGEGRTRMHQLKFRLADLLAILITFAFVAVLIVLLVLFK
ncbi:MAG: energy-coupling factor transporter transmembrane protein EcfT [Clostridia bacterium]|jgi:energy-coupling factor transport system permease protein|nr:energy-coupling factor transporter transmembrane protein EcfT [Clostridia bacterium]